MSMHFHNEERSSLEMKNPLLRTAAFFRCQSLDLPPTMSFSDIFIDVKSLPADGFGLFQLITLGGVYGYCLCYASNLISDGSELLLLVPAWAGLIGSVVLPVLGAVPDGCIVLFSGMGPDAQGKYLKHRLLPPPL